MTLPVPEDGEHSLDVHDPTYYEELPRGAFYAGNADDPLNYNQL